MQELFDSVIRRMIKLLNSQDIFAFEKSTARTFGILKKKVQTKICKVDVNPYPSCLQFTDDGSD
jgi:hypothetical protein